jgi:8-oxo-dGTP pyrophosphatase MutT (NUDIX family)
MLTILFTADLPEGSIHTRWIESTRRIVPEVEEAIERAWNAKLGQPNIKLWDGPMCRLEKWELLDNQLQLDLSPTSYRIFFGTNMSNPRLLDKYGREVGANPAGVSPALETADGFLMLGRRNSTVAYYPNLLHPFAGALEPEEADDVFKTVRRELREELHFTDRDIAEIRMLGMVEDANLRQPEPIFHVKSTRTRYQIESTVQHDEHHESWAVKATQEAVDAVFADLSQFTPVGVASLLLWGNRTFGRPWLEARLLDLPRVLS